MEGIGKEIVHCLSYWHAFHNNDNIDNLVEIIDSSHINSKYVPNDVPSYIGDSKAARENYTQDMDIWNLCLLVTQPGALLKSHVRTLGWIKLVGIDDLVSNGEQLNSTGDKERILADVHTYE